MAIEDKITAIANSIRSKTGDTDLLTLDEMPAKISSISGGGSNDFDKYLEGTITEFTSNAEEIKSHRLWWLSELVTANLPEVKKIHDSAFSECTKLKNIYVPKVETLCDSCLYCSFALERIDLPSIKRLEGWPFLFCDSLTAIVIGTTDCVLADGEQFKYDLQSWTIYVPDEALETYKTATNWCEMVAYGKLKGISELPTE